MKCPSCGAAELRHDTRDVTYSYKGESTVLPQVTGDYCPACDESILDAEESRRTMSLMAEFNKQINAALVDPALFAAEISASGNRVGWLPTVHQAECPGQLSATPP